MHHEWDCYLLNRRNLLWHKGKRQMHSIARQNFHSVIKNILRWHSLVCMFRACWACLGWMCTIMQYFLTEGQETVYTYTLSVSSLCRVFHVIQKAKFAVVVNTQSVALEDSTSTSNSLVVSIQNRVWISVCWVSCESCHVCKSQLLASGAPVLRQAKEMSFTTHAHHMLPSILVNERTQTSQIIYTH